MCAMQTGVLYLSLSDSGGATQVSTSKVYQQCWKAWEGWCAQEGVPKNAITTPKLEKLFGVSNFFGAFISSWTGLAYYRWVPLKPDFLGT